MPRADKQKDGYFQLILPSSPPPSHLITFRPPPPQTKSDSIYGQPLMPRADKQKHGSFQHIPPHPLWNDIIYAWLPFLSNTVLVTFLLLLVTFWLTLPPPSHLITFWPPPLPTKKWQHWRIAPNAKSRQTKRWLFSTDSPILSKMTLFMHDSPFSLILCCSLFFLLLLVTFWMTLPGGE